MWHFGLVIANSVNSTDEWLMKLHTPCSFLLEITLQSLIGKNIFDHDEIYEILERCIYRNSSIKAAIDIACYDAASKEKNLPLYKYLGGEVNKKLYLDQIMFYLF